MRWIRFAVLICLATILQAGLLNLFAVTKWGIKPDLLLILMVFFAISCTSRDAIITSFTIGFAADLIGSTMGTQMLSFGLLGVALANLHRIIAIRKMPHQAVAIFIISFLAGILCHFLTLLKSSSAPNAYTIIFGSSLYSALLGPFLFLPLSWWMRIKKPKR
ncbi:MAG: rod shape-determining protein MreD [Planctomycetes bacterium]|nr:rod shape-determining protein MreD [Planctomycetota bacterium]